MNLTCPLKYILLCLFIDICKCSDSKGSKPNIILIVSDDMGINDMSYHGSDQIPTPNIDSLAIFGIGLNRYYVTPMCTPSRSSLMTGRYPSNVGMQHFVIPSWEPWGLGLDQKILPEYLRDAGYDTRIVGKWHLGFYRKAYTPTQRGFNSHFGYLGPYIDYYEHNLSAEERNFTTGYDMRKNLSVHYETKGIYATDLFTDVAVKTIHEHDKTKPLFLYLAHLSPHSANYDDPLQAPPEEVEKFFYIKDKNRRKYAAMISKLDQSVGKVVKALKDSDMMTNTVILFFCDNGAPTQGLHSNSGSNYPFRGQKESPWEGAVRSGAAIWSLELSKRPRPSTQLIHVSDWLPTFAHLAGVEIETPIDGHNIWDVLSSEAGSPRKEVLCNIDDEVPYASLISDEWKLVTGTTYKGINDGWLGDIDTTERHPDFLNYGSMILRSDAGQVLSSYSYNTNNEVENQATFDEISAQRKFATYTCNGIEEPKKNSHHKCNPLKKPCLFNIHDDPCEKMNLASNRSDIVDEMLQRIEYYRKKSQPPRNQPGDSRANPGNFNNTWTWWYDELNLTEPSSVSKPIQSEFLMIFMGISVLFLVHGMWMSIIINRFNS